MKTIRIRIKGKVRKTVRKTKKGGQLCSAASAAKASASVSAKTSVKAKKNTYTKGSPLPFSTILFHDKYNPDVLIKKIQDKDEYTISKLISSIRDDNDEFISPHIYGFYECSDNELYMVMEKFDGHSLNIGTQNEVLDNIDKYLDKIFSIQNLLYDKGFILGDLFARNIIITNDNKVKFIDFDGTYTSNTKHSIAFTSIVTSKGKGTSKGTSKIKINRMSKQKLKQRLIDDYLDI